MSMRDFKYWMDDVRITKRRDRYGNAVLALLFGFAIGCQMYASLDGNAAEIMAGTALLIILFMAAFAYVSLDRR